MLVSARHGNVRISIHFYNNEADLDRMAAALGEIVWVTAGPRSDSIVLHSLGLYSEEARIESKWPRFTPYQILVAGMVGIEQDIEFFRNYDRRYLNRHFP